MMSGLFTHDEKRHPKLRNLKEANVQSILKRKSANKAAPVPSSSAAVRQFSHEAAARASRVGVLDHPELCRCRVGMPPLRPH